MDQIIRFTRDEAGAAAVEYALILVILGVALIASISAIGGALSSIFTSTAGSIGGS